MIKRIWKIAKIVLLIFVVVSCGLILISNKLISDEQVRCYDLISQVPKTDVALLLGTAKYRRSGGNNLYYQYRIDAVVKLFRAGKVHAIICSGDNSTRYYDEPNTMKADLIKAGIPADRIYLDYAGFRTLDSVVRAKAIFSQDNITVVSQPFHNERAIYIAEHKGINAVGFNAQEVSNSYGFKTNLREKLARVKTILDIHLLGTEPHFYGEKVEVDLD